MLNICSQAYAVFIQIFGLAQGLSILSLLKGSAFGFVDFPYLKKFCFVDFCLNVIISLLWVTMGVTGSLICFLVVREQITEPFLFFFIF